MTNKTSFSKTELSSPITEFAMSMGAYVGNRYIVSGTATFLAPYLAITSKHVVQHYWQEFSARPQKTGDSESIPNLDANFNLTLAQFLEEGSTGALWNVRQIFLSGGTDIAYLYAVPMSKKAHEYNWRFPYLELLPPPIGTTISGFGYSKSKAFIANDRINWEFDTRTSSGKVKEIHSIRRDSSSLNFPCIQTDARYDAGMSGGPVFNEEGKLFGLICSNLPPTNEGDEHVSYVTLIWPSMATSICVPRQNRDTSEYYLVLELCKEGFISANNWDRLRIINDSNGKTQGIQLIDT